MAIKTIECVDCGAAVIYGRLSCSACGALLASVAGGRRTGIRILQPEAEPAGFVESEPEEAAVVESAPEPEPVHLAGPRPVVPPPVVVQAHVRARPKTSPRRPRAAIAAASGDDPSVTEPAAEPVWKFASLAARESAVEAAIESTLEPELEPEPAGAAEPAAAEPAEAAEPAPGAAPIVEPAAEHQIEAHAKPGPERAFAAFEAPPVSDPGPWAPLQASEPVLVARPYQRHLAAGDADGSEPTPAPGAYRPPTVPLVTAVAVDPARSLSGSATAAASVAAPPTARGLPAGFPSTTGRVDAATIVDIAGWFVIVGATMSVLGFLLPWSVTVIGSSGVGGYFYSWGLASPTHLFVVSGLLAVLALSVLNTRVPAWLSTGLLGLAFGGLQVGLVWPYLVGPLGADVGVTVAALGGLALVIGGAVATWATRHSESDPRV